MTTSAPARHRAATTWAPMKPEPPVTTTRWPFRSVRGAPVLPSGPVGIAPNYTLGRQDALLVGQHAGGPTIVTAMPTPLARGGARAGTPATKSSRSPLAAVVATARPRGSGLPRTLSFDIGGTGLKASVLSKHGELLHEPVRTPTSYPLRPEQLVACLVELATGLPSYQRISAGFPGMMRSGRVLSAPHFVSAAGPEGKPSADLVKAWTGFDLQSALASALGKPCRAANDADVQGAALVKGEGLEFVITLGTGVGTALFWEGKLAPHLELAHHPLGKGGRSYNEVLGEPVRQKVGNKRWNARVGATLPILKALVFYDHCYIGGGNSKRVTVDLPPDVSLADNTAGIVGGIKLWERT